MNGRINKIIFIINYNLNKWDYDRLGIEFLRSKGLTVEVWDITNYLYSNSEGKKPDTELKNYDGIRILFKKNDILKAISLLYEGCLVNCTIGYDIHTVFLFRALSKYKIRYFVFGMVSFPDPYPVQSSFIKRMVSFLKKGITWKFIPNIEHVLNEILLKYFFLFGIAPASVILLSGEKSAKIFSYPVNETTTRLWTHNLDYDIYLKDTAGSGDTVRKTGVFLDEYLPFHPDIHNKNEMKSPVIADEYYPKICDFFRKLETETNTQIVIAAHPKSDYEDKPDFFCGRNVIKGKTAHLVRESSFVIAHMSTSINFAVLYNKPILFITTDNLQKQKSGIFIPGLYIPAVAAELEKTPINLDHMSVLNLNEEMEVNDKAYLRYRERYIKKEGTPEKPTWDIFYSYLQHNTVS
jgi:hypothetical protein